MKPATVGFDISALDADFKEHALRGIGRYVSELARYFSACDHPLLNIGTFDHRMFSHPAAERVIQMMPAGKATLRQQVVAPLMLRGAKRHGFDVLHFPAHMDAPSWSPFPYMITVLDLIPLVCADLYKADRPGWRYKLARWLEIRGIKNARMVLAISETTARDVHALLGVPFERIAVTPLGVKDSFYAERGGENPEQLRAKYGIPAGRSIVLYVGGIDPRKNWKSLLDVQRRLIDFYKLRQGTPPVLVFAGRIDQDRQYPRLQARVRELDLEKDVVFAGYVPDDELRSLYGMAAVFCFLSLYEGFGLTPLEAMAAGAPVVSSDRSCMPEVLGNAAMLVDPENVDQVAAALVEVIDDDSLASRLRRRGQRRAATFTWNRTGELTLQAYERFFNLSSQSVERARKSAAMR